MQFPSVNFKMYFDLDGRMDAIHNQNLAMRTEAKYLGVTISSDRYPGAGMQTMSPIRETLRLVSSRETLGLHHKLQRRLPTRHSSVQQYMALHHGHHLPNQTIIRLRWSSERRQDL